jgi:hypothetical protein
VDEIEQWIAAGCPNRHYWDQIYKNKQ